MPTCQVRMKLAGCFHTAAQKHVMMPRDHMGSTSLSPLPQISETSLPLLMLANPHQWLTAQTPAHIQAIQAHVSLPVAFHDVSSKDPPLQPKHRVKSSQSVEAQPRNRGNLTSHRVLQKEMWHNFCPKEEN